MPTTPYAKALVSLNGGGLVSGGQTVTPLHTVQLQGENTSGWRKSRWEIIGPPGWAVPAGWTDEDGVAVYVGVTGNPPLWTLPSTAGWGKWIVTLVVNDGEKDGDAAHVDMRDSTLALSMVSANGLEDIGTGEGTQFDDVRSWTGALQAMVRQVDTALGLISGTATEFKAGEAISVGDWIVTANDVNQPNLVLKATLANLQNASMAVIAVALENASLNDNFSAAAKGAVVDYTVHGLTVDALAVEAGFVVLNTTTARATWKRSMDGDDVQLGQISKGTTSQKGNLAVDPQPPRGVDTISLLDPRFGAYVLVNGDLVVDTAFQRIVRKYAVAGCRIALPRRKTDKTGTNYTIRDDEMVIDLSDLNAGDFTDSSVQRYPLSNITVVGDSALPLSVYATTFRSKLNDFGFVRKTSNTGIAASIKSVDVLRMTMLIEIPLNDLWPVFVPGATYKYGQIVRPTAGHNGYMYRCRNVSAVSGAEPTWTTTESATSVSGGVTFECFKMRPSFPLHPKEWINHYISTHAAKGPLHNGRFLVLDIVNDGANGSPVQIRVAIRNTAAFNTMSTVVSSGTTPPVMTISGTGVKPLGLRVECTTGGLRAAAFVRVSEDHGATFGAPVAISTGSVVVGTTGFTLAFPLGTYTTDNVWTATNLSGNDPNNGTIRWRLRRWAFHEQVGHLVWENISFYQEAGFYMSGWRYITQSPRRSTGPISHNEGKNICFTTYPPPAFDTSDGCTRSMGGFAREFGNSGLASRDWFVDCVSANAWPMAAQPGNSYFTPLAGDSLITQWAATTAMTVGQVRRPTGTGSPTEGGGNRNGFQYRVLSISGTGTTGGSPPAWPTTWGATVTDNPGANQVVWKAEYEFEVGTAPAWTATTAITVGTIRLPTTRNGLRFRCVVAGTTGSTEPLFVNPTSKEALINIFDRITDGTVQWSVEFDLGTELQTSIKAPYNVDYMQFDTVDTGNHGKVVWMDNPHGQAREYSWKLLNPVFGDHTLFADTPRYTNEYGAYGQLDWNGGDCAVTQGLKVKGNAGDFKFQSIHTESNGRLFDVAGPGAMVLLEGCRMQIANSSYPRGQEWGLIDGDNLTIRDTSHTAFGHQICVVVSSSTGVPFKLRLDNFRVSGGNTRGVSNTASCTASRSVCPTYRMSAGMTIVVSCTYGSYSTVFPVTQVNTCTLQANDAQDWLDVRGWELAKAINRDCGYNWAASTTYAGAAVVVPGTTDATLRYDALGQPLEYYVTAGGGGLSGTTEPTWPTTLGATVVSGALTFTCRLLSTSALFAYSDASNSLFVQSKFSRGNTNPYDETESPVRFISEFANGPSLAFSGTAMLAEGGALEFSGGSSYPRQELAWITGGAVQPANTGNAGGSRAPIELSIDNLSMIDVNMTTIRSYSGRWVIPVTGWSEATVNSDVTWTDLDARQLTVMTISGTPVPLRNAGGKIVFTGPSAFASHVNKLPEWTTKFDVHIDPFAESYSGGTPSTLVRIEVVKDKHGFYAKRVPALAAGITETRAFTYARVPNEVFTPLSVTSATCMGWFKNESLSLGLDWAAVGWVNSAVNGNKIGPLLQATGGLQPVVTMTANGVFDVTFDGVDDWIRGAITTPYAQPLHFFFTLKDNESGSATQKYIFSQKGDATTPFQLSYRSDNNGFYAATPTNTNTHVANLEDQFHTIAYSVDNTPLSNATRATLIVDNGTKSHQPTRNSTGANTLDGFSLGARFTGGVYAGFLPMSLRGDVCVFQGQMTTEEKRKVSRYLMNKVGDDV